MLGIEWPIFLSEMAAIGTVIAGGLAFWQLFIKPRHEKRDKAALQEKQREREQHDEEIAQLKQHFKLDNTVTELKKSTDQNSKDIQSVAKDVSELRRDVLANKKETTEVHSLASSIDNKLEKVIGKMDGHIEQAARDKADMSGRFSALETKLEERTGK